LFLSTKEKQIKSQGNKMKTIAIDPGVSGGFAWVDGNGDVHAVKMPDGMTGQADFLRSLAVELPGLTAVMEKVGGYREGNSGPSAATFARHCGNLEAALYVLGIPTIQVTPKKWMNAIGVPPKLKEVERKNWIKDLAARRFPHLKVTLATADALGILIYSGDLK
jgi:hypothetical protein